VSDFFYLSFSRKFFSHIMYLCMLDYCHDFIQNLPTKMYLFIAYRQKVLVLMTAKRYT
jgi:hypothetical protein